MRLINTATRAFEEFIGQIMPEYAILSHTWGNEEIDMTCRIAAQAGIKYAWVDTCNIDKSSSAELTEAINSMFQWYQRSKVCYVILEDLPASTSIELLKNCRWFTRGWTLQELIAPSSVFFFDQDWNYRGSKAGLAEQLSRITNIDIDVLLHRRSLPTVAVAQRMSWVALRETTRIEDMAYCLVGIFDVNMPLLYGEEGKAFRRLQEEIIKSTSDLSIFAWKLPKPRELANMVDDRSVYGILAQSPAAFASCWSLTKDLDHVPSEFVITNIGVKTQIQVITMNLKSGTGPTQCFVLPLRCSSASKWPFGVRLRKCGLDQFVREDPWNLTECDDILYINAPRDRYFLTELPKTEVGPISIMSMRPFISRMRSHVLQIICKPGVLINDVWNWGRFDDEDELFFISGDTSWDSSAIRVRVKIPEERFQLACTFYAARWSCLEHNFFQYTLIEDQPITSALNEFQIQLEKWNSVSSEFIKLLVHYNIPKTSSIAIRRSGMQKTAFISCVATLKENTNVCQNKFWSVSFSVRFLEGEFVSEIPRTNWTTWD